MWRLGKAESFGLALLFASSMIPSLAHGQCLPDEKTDATLFRFHLPATCTEEEKRQYPIRSNDVVEAIKSGKAIDIENALIQRPFTLRSITVEAEVSITRTRLMDRVDWSYATFRRVLTLDGNTFAKSADFTGAVIEKDLLLRNATFEAEANFRGFQIEGLAAFNGAVFKQKASFNRAQINGGAFFRPATSGKEVRPVRFEGAADFGSARIGGQAEFSGAVFKQGASFNGAQINGSALFRDAIFEGEKVADFGSARIEGQAEFSGAVFKQGASFNGTEIKRGTFFRGTIFEGEEAADFQAAQIGVHVEFEGAVLKHGASFNGAQINGNVLFFSATSGKEVRSVRFEGAADFGSARIEGHAVFQGTVLKQGASFNSAQINGNTLFRGAIFEGEKVADFGSARIEGQAEFDGAVFRQGASFNSAEIRRNALFRDAIFEGDRAANFIGARIEGQAEFSGAVLKYGASFNSAYVEGSVFFKGAKFDKDFDLHGFTYNRIDVSWEDLKGRLKSRDSQVYAQLETAFRQSGRGATASEVYYTSRHVEGDKIEFNKERFRWFNDRRARWLVGYGQSPFRLLWFLLFFVGIGMFVFRREGAVEPKEREQCPLHSGSECITAIHRLPYGLAFWVSLNAFLPGADVAAANAWGPTPSRYLINKKFLKITYIGFATILRMVGWIVLVLGFSALPEFLLR